ncbi:MAG: hypothetical protein B0D91_10580 [Oceanospirillales bacterium LUC14_002_19_P2]|nr:MAG: hypothetical protein B0D91_10580 [Oceanospirillales bacterium LUC14_002_19_P2]
MSIPHALLAGLKYAITSIITKVTTGPMLRWFLLYAAELIVKSTKTPHDDVLFNKVKEAVDGTAQD